MEKVNNYEWIEYSLPDGWHELARKMIEECEAVEPNFEIIDLKEKWGMIRMYAHPCTNKISEIEHKYEKISKYTCCKCGRPAVKYSISWILPWCDECGTDDERYYKRFEDGQN